NSSNNTLFADSKGEIAYLHPQFIPVRDDSFDWTRPVDGSDPRTEWQGLHSVKDTPHLLNPKTGSIQNTNNQPHPTAGPESPKAADYPKYMDTVGETPRGLHALRVLGGKSDFTLASLIGAAFDPYLTGFARLLPDLEAAYDALPEADPRKAQLKEQIAL